ncbi:uncharacterized protein G2W53_009299 [Senna tora]|uniref:Uncharacterized protein n=1 Tax=Senna tora TaxID=362788 RepID=A0A834WX60_9FABA|nr:uncharacterized protein G2W53_009299 [Senna tora]
MGRSESRVKRERMRLPIADLKSQDDVGSVPWSSKFAATVWLLWKQRNEWVFNNKKEVGLRLIPAIDNYMKDLQTISTLPHIKGYFNQFGTLNFIKWKPPEEGWIKIKILMAPSPLFSR